MTISEDHWWEIETQPHAQGVVSLRLYPDSPHDLFLAVRHPGRRRALVLRTDRNTAVQALRSLRRLPRTRGLELEFVALPDGQHDLQVILAAEEFREVFNPLASDIARTAQAATSRVDAVLAVVGRFEHWRHLLQAVGDEGLTAEARRGLFGELWVLSNHLLTVLPASEAVRAWTGPTGTNQDFQLATAAIEVKTSAAKQPQTVVITNERELDERGTGILLLAHVSVDERQGGEGESLNALVDRVRGRLVEPAARAAMDDLLVRSGYLPHQRSLYDEPRYSLRTVHFWRVTGDFPRITETDLRPGVGDCRYRISIAGLETYAVSADGAAAAIRGSHA